jgi:NFU1 iron-sulfur cluster scaffold homolog, mitochondrial
MEDFNRDKLYNRNVHIYLESNPNPNSLKFVVNFMLVPEGKSYDFPDMASAQGAPLALELFDTFPFVERVFYMSNFITVTKSADVEWDDIKDDIKNFIKNHIESDQPLLEEADGDDSALDEGTELELRIRGILDEYIRPAVEQDGGAIAFHSYNDGVVKVLLQGSCSGCPSAIFTLKAGIENLLKRFIPEVRAVEAING